MDRDNAPKPDEKANRGWPAFQKGVGLILILVPIVLLTGSAALRLMLSRKRELKARVKVGQPIVRAIEQYRIDNKSYPPSLANLAPTYLPTAPKMQTKDNGRMVFGWDYNLVTNGTSVSYKLRCSLPRAGIVYEPPNWKGYSEVDGEMIIKSD